MFSLIVFIVVAGTLAIFMTVLIAFLLFLLYIQKIYFEPELNKYLNRMKSIEDIEKDINNDKK